MDPVSLEIFQAVAAELSITRAAKLLGRVQSNVTTRIQQLEEDLGVSLFLREGKRLQLSPEGERFLDYARRILALNDEARQVMRSAAPSGSLRIGSMESTAATRLPTPLSTFHKAWPEVRLKLTTAPSRQMIEQVINGTVDCAFAALPSCGDLSTMDALQAAGLSGFAAFTEEIVLVAPPGTAINTGPEGALETVLETVGKAQRVRSLAAFVEGCSYRLLGQRWLDERAIRPDVHEVGSYHAMLACVAAGDCICFMPLSVLQLLKHPLPVDIHPVATVDTLFLYRQHFETPAFLAFANLLRPNGATS